MLQVSENNSAVERRARMPRFGVAIFDNHQDLRSGWACLPGKEEFRFRHPVDLPNDSIWITSVDGNEFNDIQKLHHLRPSDFFRSKLRNIAADIGMPTEGEDWARPAVRALSEVVNRAALIAVQVYQWDDPLQMLRAPSLVEDIRKALVKPMPVLQNMRSPLLSAYQSYSSPERGNTFEPGSTIVTLRLNRLAYAKRLLQTSMPDGAWAYTGKEETHGFSYPLERALNPDLPCIVEATIETSQTDPDISILAAFGAGPGRRNGLRSWISQPELQWLSKYAKVHISRVYYTTNTRPLIERFQLPELLAADDLWELSIAAGLVAECHWSALTIPAYSPNLPSKKDITVYGVWLRAVDRALCFDLSLRAHKAGFLVKSYGNGSIVVSLAKTRLPELLNFSMENGIAHPSFREIFERNGLS